MNKKRSRAGKKLTFSTIKLATLLLIITTVLVSISGCQKNTDQSNKDLSVATVDGKKITKTDVYDHLKTTASNKQAIAMLIIYQAFDDQYGKKVTKEADKQYRDLVKSKGSEKKLVAELKKTGYTIKSLKKEIKTNLAVKEGMKEHLKITEQELKKAWDKFHPEVTARIIKIDDKTTAEATLKDLKENHADFAKVAKDKSTDQSTKSKGGGIKFDSASTNLPDQVKKVAFTMKNGDLSDLITVTDESNFSTSYYIIKIEQASSKGTSRQKYESKLKKIITSEKENDSKFQKTVIKKVLKASKIEINDSDLKNILSEYGFKG